MVGFIVTCKCEGEMVGFIVMRIEKLIGGANDKCRSKTENT